MKNKRESKDGRYTIPKTRAVFECACEIQPQDWDAEQTTWYCHLHTAAPEMLKALKILLKRVVLDAEVYQSDGNEPIWALIADATAVIAKAEGREGAV